VTDSGTSLISQGDSVMMNGSMMDGGMMSGGMMIAMGAFCLLTLALMILGVAALVKYLRS